MHHTPPIHQEFQITFKYTVYFTEGLFTLDNSLLRDAIAQDAGPGVRKVYFVIDNHVAEADFMFEVF